MHWRRQGDLGELSAMEWFASRGAIVCFPIGHSPDWDFVAELDGRLPCPGQVVHLFPPPPLARDRLHSRWQQSWSGLVKRFDPESCDYLFAVVGDGRRWCIPSEALDGKASVGLGGPKYAAFEVDPGRPLPARMAEEDPSTIAS